MFYFRKNRRRAAVFAVLLGIISAACTGANDAEADVVVVRGQGTVRAQPDTVQIQIYYSNIAPATKQAKDAVDAGMREIIGILKAEGVADTDIRTEALSYREEIEYHSGRPVRIGERAEQTLAVTIHNIIENPQRFPALLDKLSAIDKLTVNNIHFDIENKTEVYKQSREAAFQKARDKAAQYAALAGRALGGVRSIIEGAQDDAVFPRAQNKTLLRASAAYDAAASVPAGEEEITTDISVTFQLK
jgi:uncharacterized protein YggE